MRLLSPILQRVVYPALGKSGYFHWRASSPLRVVTYHGVVSELSRNIDPVLEGALVSTASFQSQLRLLKKCYNVISPEHFLWWLQKKRELPERAVLLTCDDGLLNNLTTMLPILQEEGLQCLFFVTGASARDRAEMLWYIELYLMVMEAQGIEQPSAWHGMPVPGIPAERQRRFACWHQLLRMLSRFGADGRQDFLREAVGWWGVDPGWEKKYLENSRQQDRFQLLCPAELKQLVHAGMTIGAHTMSHPVLSEQPAELASFEINECRQQLRQISGQTVWALAYPFGDPASVATREYRLAEAAGYECAFLNVGGALGPALARFMLPRIHVTAEMSLPVFEAHISGFHEALHRAVRG